MLSEHQCCEQANTLIEGEEVFIPAKQIRWHEAATATRHRFHRKGSNPLLKVQVCVNGEPVANQRFTLVLSEGGPIEGQTDAEGYVNAQVPASTTSAILHWADPENGPDMTFAVGALEPASTIKGAQARLASLGIPCGPVDGILGSKTEAAIRWFQGTRDGLEDTGCLDAATIARLRDEHGS